MYRLVYKVLLIAILTILINSEIYSQKDNQVDSINQLIENSSKPDKAKYLNTLADYYLSGSPDKSIIYANKALILSEEFKDTEEIARSSSILGEAYFYLDDYKKSLFYFEKLLDIRKISGTKSEISSAYNNMGVISRYTEDYNKALEYYNKSLEIKLDINDEEGISSLMNNIGVIHELELNDYNKALEFYKRSLTYEKKIDDPDGISTSLLNIGAVLGKMERYKEAEKYLFESVRISDSLNYLITLEINYESLYLMYKQKGDFKKSLSYNELYTNLKDSLYNAEKYKQIAELEVKYETKKKQEQIENLNKRKKLQQTILLLVVIALFSFFITMIVLFRQNKQKKRANIILSDKNSEINLQKEEIQSIADSLKIANDKVILINEEITEKNKHITDSIQYAKRIQKAVFLQQERINEYFPENFVILKPKEIVSGDFFRFEKIGDHYIFAAVDCTGHGVPGAFMSLLSYAFINEIITKEEIVQTNQVLDELRKQIIKTLQQSADNYATRDGLDISLCALNFKTMELQFSGAHNPLLIIPEKESYKERVLQLSENKQAVIHKFSDNISNPVLIELKGDKMPVGFSKKIKGFSFQTLQMKKGDKLYLFSDGYMDQFGGKYNRKFLYKNLRNLIVSISNKSMKSQRELLIENFNNWKGENIQIDDVLVMGIEIT